MRDATWRGVERVAILVHVAASPAGTAVDLPRDLCARIERLACAGAPIPVECIAFGDPSIHQSGTLTLLVHAAVEPLASVRAGAAGSLVILAMRPHRQGPLTLPPVLFGAAPRSTVLEQGETVAALDGVLRSALCELLPWLRPEQPILPARE